MNEIAKQTHNLLDIVSNYSEAEMKKVFAQISALKAALEEADMFYEASVQFAQLEAYALIRAVELSNGKKPLLTGKNKAERALAAVWLYKMTEKERRETIFKCQDGKTILAIYKEEHYQSKDDKIAKLKKEIVAEITDDLKLDGICHINKYENDLKKLNPEIKQDIRNGIRNTLLLQGAVGLNDKKGTYIIPERQENQIYDALEARFRSLDFDFASLLSLSEKCKMKPTFRIGYGTQHIQTTDILYVLAAHRKSINLSFTPYAKKQMLEFLNTLYMEVNSL